MEIINIENRYFFFDVKAVEREQENEDDPWWNVHVIYKTKCVNFEDFGETMTKNELPRLRWRFDSAHLLHLKITYELI